MGLAHARAVAMMGGLTKAHGGGGFLSATQRLRLGVDNGIATNM